MECSLKFGLRQRSKKKGYRVLIFGGGMGGREVKEEPFEKFGGWGEGVRPSGLQM